MKLFSLLFTAFTNPRISGSKLSAFLKAAFLFTALLPMALSSQGQGLLISGTVTDVRDQQPLPAVSIYLKNDATIGTLTDADGKYSLSVPSDTGVVVFSYVGYSRDEQSVAGRNVIDVALAESSIALDEVVLIGYGTQLKRDLTGAITSVQEKDFNKGLFTSPDQLIQGKVAGVQISNNSGQPGVATTIKVRGNSALTGTGQPLFVVDGIPLSGSSPRPNTDDGDSPAGNPLNFINPLDIASIDVLKDASATAIYGSRGAYGVVIITTKKGQTGEPKVDASASVGVAYVQNKVDVLNANQYRDAISYYGVTENNDKGASSDALSSIFRAARQQQYNVGVSGGNYNGKYRLSLGYYDQEGIMLKSALEKFNASVSGNFKFLESKRLGVDFNLMGSQYTETLPIVRNAYSIVGAALYWNPTDSLKHADGTVNILQGNIQNPLALSQYYNDKSKVSTVLTSISPYYEFTDWLEFKMLASINYATGSRRTSFNQLIDNPAYLGVASVYNNENINSQFTNTLTFHGELISTLRATAIVGYEYLKSNARGSFMGGSGVKEIGFGNFGLDYTNYLQYSDPSNRVVSSFANPTTELQSYFGRIALDYQGKYFLTGTFRADGSSKFGKDNKYGYFPSFSGAWVLSEEEFFKTLPISFLKVRVGWGKTGNQEFPAGSSTLLYGFQTGAIGQINNPNPDLKWQADEQFNIGIDFAIIKNKISGTLDYFQKTTTDLLFPSYPIQPAPPGAIFTWINLDGEIRNRGLEAAINTTLIQQSNLKWNLGFNTTLMKNNVSGLPAPILTGLATGGAAVQVIKNGSPIGSFYTRRFMGIDRGSGLSIFQDDGNTSHVVGNPNPKALLGINSTLTYKKFSLIINMYGAFGQSLYNNTLSNALNVGHVKDGNNIALSEFQKEIKESVANPVEASSRYVERADYFKLSNVSLNYNFGQIGNAFNQAEIYFTSQNLFLITRYSGFNPEVNIDRNNYGVPSLGIDNQAYPLARTFIVGIKFSL